MSEGLSRFPPLGPSCHIDDFTRRNLPPPGQWPDLLLDRPEFQYPEYLNAAVELTDRIVEKGLGDNIALIGNGRQRTYKELTDWSNRLAHALVENYGVKPGNRVLIRSGNNPALVAAWLAATKAGAVVVNTMPLLRARELSKIVDKAEIRLALCDSRIADELVACAKDSKFLKRLRNLLSLAQATSSSAMRLSQSASLISALSTIFDSSRARNSGMVLTTTAPALVAASQAATRAGLLPERMSTRLPGFTP